MQLAASVLVVVVLSVGACDQSAGAGPTGAGVAHAPILQPFQGRWVVDTAKTVALWRAAGVPATEIATQQTMANQLGMPLHPDLDIRGNLALMPGAGIRAPITGEYAFFALHPHGRTVCGKAWKHEDRDDPGDVGKCYVRLELKDGELHFASRERDDSADPDDPDVTNMPLLAGSETTCEADKAPAPAWSPWLTYVFKAAR